MIVVKLGGSILTTKGGALRVRRRVLARLAGELRGAGVAGGAGGGAGLVVLHGAGSFGHTLAKEAGLRGGLQRPRQRRAVVQVRRDVLTLHTAVLDALAAAGLKPWSLPTGATTVTAGSELAALLVEPFRLAAANGFTPVAMGDVVLDRKQGAAIVSADGVAQRLAAELPARRMVFATDVDGIYTAPPGTPGAERIGACTPGELRRLTLGGSRKTDVTGGMAGKAAAIAAMAERGTEVWVVNGLVPGAVREALRGRPKVGTVVRRDA